jgi:hypothetical protein
MVGYRLDRTLSDNGTVSRGIVTHDGDGWLESITEHTKLQQRDKRVASYDDGGAIRAWFNGDEATSMNLFGFTPAAMTQFFEEFSRFLQEFAEQPKSEFYIPYAMNRLKERGAARMQVLRSDAEWFGVTYREDRPDVVARIQSLIDRGQYPASLWS